MTALPLTPICIGSLMLSSPLTCWCSQQRLALRLRCISQMHQQSPCADDVLAHNCSHCKDNFQPTNCCGCVCSSEKFFFGARWGRGKRGERRPSLQRHTANWIDCSNCMQRFTTAQQLAKEMHAFNREQGLPRGLIPSASILRAADRLDLLSEIQRHGGAVSLAAPLGMRTQRGSGYACSAAAAQALSEFAESCNARSTVAREEWRMPTQRQLKQAGRYDLLTAITKFGQVNLAQAADLRPNSRGKPGRVVTCR